MISPPAYEAHRFGLGRKTQLRTVYVIETCENPRDRRFPETGARTASFRRISTLQELKSALKLHEGPMDHPRPSPDALEYYGQELLSGRHLYQFTLRLAGRPSILHRPPIYPLCGLRSLGDLCGTTWRHTYRAAATGMLDLVEADWDHQHFQYAVLNEKAAWWSLSFARYRPIHDLPKPWFSDFDIRFACFNGEIAWRRTDSVEVFTNISWLRWAARRQKREVFESILSHQTRA